MADVTRTSSSLSNALSRPRADSIATAREAKRHAGVAESDDSPATKYALKRLDRLLSSEDGPRQDAPRGYYLNFTV